MVSPIFLSSLLLLILHHPHPHPHPHRSLLIPQQQLQQLPLTATHTQPHNTFQTCLLLPREKVTNQPPLLLPLIKSTLGPFSLLPFVFSFPRHATITTIHGTNHFLSNQLNRFPNGHHRRWFRRFVDRLCLLDALRRLRVAHQRLQHKGLRGSGARSSGCRLCLLDQSSRRHLQGVRSS